MDNAKTNWTAADTAFRYIVHSDCTLEQAIAMCEGDGKEISKLYGMMMDSGYFAEGQI